MTTKDLGSDPGNECPGEAWKFMLTEEVLAGELISLTPTLYKTPSDLARVNKLAEEAII